MRHSVHAFLTFACVYASACATSFQGEAHFPGGPKGCFDRCAADGLVMQSYVFVGEYTSGCVCSLKLRKAESEQPQADASAASSAAAVGVITQMRNAEAARNNSMAGAQPNTGVMHPIH